MRLPSLQIIADSGSTHTEWLLTEGSRVLRRFDTEGLNPNLLSVSAMRKVASAAFAAEARAADVHRVFFYGAGCALPSRQQELREALQPLFPSAQLVVKSDMLGAARALFQHGEGVAAILGTGANAAYYADGELRRQKPSAGYILGDEGSGSALGRKLLQRWFRAELTEELRELLSSRYDMRYDHLISALYRSPMPNRFLASFAPFVSEHLHHEEMRALATEAFDEFFRYQLRGLAEEGMVLGFVGSVAWHFRELIREVAERYPYTIQAFLPKPVDRLLSYHVDEKI